MYHIELYKLHYNLVSHKTVYIYITHHRLIEAIFESLLHQREIYGIFDDRVIVRHLLCVDRLAWLYVM